MGKADRKFLLSAEEITKIVEQGAKEGLKAFNEESKNKDKERQNKMLHSTKTLLRNYTAFKDNCKNAVYSVGTATDIELCDIIRMMKGNYSEEYFSTLSIKDSTIRTRLMMNHVDDMLGVYRKRCLSSSNIEMGRRYRVINYLYLLPEGEKKTVGEIAEEENVAERTVFRDIGIATKEIGILFFGVDGI